MRDHFYREIIINNTTFARLANVVFDFQASTIIIINDEDKREISFSFNGSDLDGKLLKRERISMENKHQSKIWVKTDSATGSGTKIRIWAWI